MDYTTLQLNNLLYQKNHYLKAISACKDFKSKYPDIELVPVEEFYKESPTEFKKDVSLKDDPHKEMLERLNFELFQVQKFHLSFVCQNVLYRLKMVIYLVFLVSKSS